MKIKKKDVDRRMDNFEQVCRDKGIKLTHQRIEIFREVAQTGDHPDADQVFQRVRKRIPTISLDTVYRALWLMNDLGLVVTLGSNREPTRFDANLDTHHHFVCGSCGFTHDFYSEELEKISLPDEVGTMGAIKTTHVEVRGLCQSCIRKGV